MGSGALNMKMWKDEQLGLTFLWALNGHRAPVKDEDDSKLSWRGILFALIWCVCGAFSTYNFNIELTKGRLSFRRVQLAWNEFMPCCFSHMMLLLVSAVVRAPKVAPFRHLYLTSRFLGVILMSNALLTFVQLVT